MRTFGKTLLLRGVWDAGRVELARHLQLQGEIEYESVVERIREYMKVEARLPSSKTVNEVYADPCVIWGKGHEKGKGFEKGKGSEKGKSNWPDKSKGKGVQKTEAEFEWRTCHNCGKVGHLIRECYHLGTTDWWPGSNWVTKSQIG